MKTLILFPFMLLGSLLFTSSKSSDTPQSASQIIQQIKQHVICPWSEKTVDTFKAGDTTAIITGIAVCMMPSLDVLEKAVAARCNLVITHEPTFYNHLDDTTLFSGDPVFEKKMKFIRDNHLVIWRFHDHWHCMKPDGIMKGLENKLGWAAYRQRGNDDIYVIPKCTIAQLIAELQKKIGPNAFRLIGDENQEVSRIAFSPGAAGEDYQIGLLSRFNVDVLICGEAREWETYEYAYDAIKSGEAKALIVTGHAYSEEVGMEYCATWLRQFITNIPITFIPRGNSYKTIQ